jgi:hypothetical protein
MSVDGFLDSYVGSNSSDSVIVTSVWAWIKPFAPFNTRQDIKKQILIFVLAQHNNDKPCIVCQKYSVRIHAEHINREARNARTASFWMHVFRYVELCC